MFSKDTLTNYYDDVDEDGEPIKIAITDISAIWRELEKACEGRLKRIGSLPFFVQPSGEIRIFGSTNELFGFFFSRGMNIRWSDRTNGAITKSEFLCYIGTVAEAYDLITALPHYPPIKEIFCSRTIAPAKTDKLDGLINMFNFATDVDRQLLKAMFMTPFWGGAGGTRPAFLIDGLVNDAMGNRGIGKTSITDALVHLCGDCVDISNKTDGEDIRKRLLTCGDVRIVRMDNIKSSTMSNDVIESLITAKKMSGHKLYTGHKSVPNWFTYVMTFNDAMLSRDMAQRTVIIRLKRPTYSASWYTDICEYIDRHREALIADIGYELTRKSDSKSSVTRFPVWERDVLSKACTDMKAVLAQIAEEQANSDSDSQLSEEIRDVLISRISKLYRYKEFTHEKVYFDPYKNDIAISRAVVYGWVAPLFGKDATRQYVSKRFESARPSEIYKDAKIYLGDRYLLWLGNPESRLKAGKPISIWRASYLDNSTSIAVWDIAKL